MGEISHESLRRAGDDRMKRRGRELRGDQLAEVSVTSAAESNRLDVAVKVSCRLIARVENRGGKATWFVEFDSRNCPRLKGVTFVNAGWLGAYPGSGFGAWNVS